jgi:hypothetical protein
MKYFEKIAVGPKIVYEPLPQNLGGFYLAKEKVPGVLASLKKLEEAPDIKILNSLKKKLNIEDKTKLLKKYQEDALKRGLIVIDKNYQGITTDSPRLKKILTEFNLHQDSIKRHELVHYLRHKKKEWSSRHTGIIPRLVEETAAYSVGEFNKNKLLGFSKALGAELKNPFTKFKLGVLGLGAATGLAAYSHYKNK